MGSLYIPDPVRCVSIKLGAEDIDVLSIVSDLLRQGDELTTVELLHISTHSCSAVIFGKKNTKIFFGIWILGTEITDSKSNIAVRLGFAHVIAVGNAAIAVNQFLQDGTASLQFHRRQYRLDCPDREREFFHLVPDTLPCLLDGSAKVQRDTERIRSCLVKRFLRLCHLYDVLILIAWIRCDLQRDDFIHHLFELVQIHDIVGESVTPAV